MLNAGHFGPERLFNSATAFFVAAGDPWGVATAATAAAT